MKKILPIFLIIFLIISNCVFAFGKKQKPVIFLTATDPSLITTFDETIEQVNVFKVGDKIYFTIYTPDGFKSDYIKYQIVKQDDKAHIGGYTRIRNITRRITNKNSYSDYFTLSQTGKYYIQVFDIQNLHQWLAIGAFQVVDK